MTGGNRFKAGVQRAEEILGPPLNFKRNNFLIRYDDRANIEVMRSHRCNNKVTGVRKDDRAPTTQGISRRPRRRSHNNTICPIGVEVSAVYKCVNGNHGGGVPLEQRTIIERKAKFSKNRQVRF